MTRQSKTHTITLPDGRVLSYGIYGEHASSVSLTIFYFHGFPASHHEAEIFDSAARAHGIRIVAPDRPGMGGSTFQVSRTIKDWASDVLALADHVRVDTFGVLGVSGGAPYVLACCVAIPATRLRVAGIVSGLYPVSLGLEGMLLEPRLLLNVAPWATWLVEKVLEWGIGSAAKEESQTDSLEKLIGNGMRGRPMPDRDVWERNEDGLRTMLVESVRGSFREGGARGAAWEARLFGSGWGFDLAEVQLGERKLVLWHGEGDLNSPVAMAEKAHALLKGSELRVGQGEAHMSLLVHRVDEVLGLMKERVFVS